MKLKYRIYLVLLIALAGMQCSKKEYPNQIEAGRKGTYIIQNEGGFQLIRNGKPYEIRGACAGYDYQLLNKIGVNSIRTYGMSNATSILDSAQKYDMTVTLTLWLHHIDYFDYSDSIRQQQLMELLELEVSKYKDHPALLIWCIGNEFQLDREANIDAYKFLNQVAQRIHELDPNHPTTTAVPGYPRKHIPIINQYCPDLDFISFNKFGEIHSIQEKRENPIWGYDGAYLITEFGNYGYWDPYLPKAWGMTIEPLDTVKANQLEEMYLKMAKDSSLLGSYSFYFGNKQEYTPTWFSMQGPNGENTAMIETVRKLWKGTTPKNKVPVIQNVAIKNIDSYTTPLKCGNTYQIQVHAYDPEHDSLRYEFEILPQVRYRKNLLDLELRPTPEKVHFNQISSNTWEFVAPENEGPMRIFTYVRDGNQHLASANLPVKFSRTSN